jgi:O-antigen/teichoic acid export membrane protein
MTGTTIAKVLPIIISPILTRFYSPEDFGLLALFISIITVLSSIVTARYDSAIMLPKGDLDALHILVLSIVIALFFSGIVLMIIIFFNKQITIFLNNEDIAIWLYLIPFMIFINGVYQSFIYWSNRKKLYKRMAIYSVIQSSSYSGFSLIFGFLSLHFGLILGRFLGIFSSFIIFGKTIWNENRLQFRNIKKIQIINMARQYSNFLKFSTPGALLQTMATSGIAILINILFDSKIVGFYYFADIMVRTPIGFILSSVSQVYHQKAVGLYYESVEDLRIYTYTLQKKLILILFPLMIIIYIIAPDMFQFIFGKKWEIAGEYLRYFLPVVFFGSIYSPIAHLIDILEEQKFELIWKTSFFIFQVSSLYISSLYFDFPVSIFIMSCFASLHYIYINYYLNHRMLQLIKEEK